MKELSYEYEYLNNKIERRRKLNPHTPPRAQNYRFRPPFQPHLPTYPFSKPAVHRFSR